MSEVRTIKGPCFDCDATAYGCLCLHLDDEDLICPCHGSNMITAPVPKTERDADKRAAEDDAMTDQISLLCFFEGDPDEVHTFADVTAANHFVDGVFCGAAAYGCGSVEVYIRNADGSIFDAGDEDEEIQPKRLARVKALFLAADDQMVAPRDSGGPV